MHNIFCVSLSKKVALWSIKSSFAMLTISQFVIIVPQHDPNVTCSSYLKYWYQYSYTAPPKPAPVPSLLAHKQRHPVKTKTLSSAWNLGDIQTILLKKQSMSNFPLMLAITAKVRCACLRYAYCTPPIQRKLKLQPSNAQIKDEPRNWFKDLSKKYSCLLCIFGGWQLQYWVHTRLKQDANANANAITQRNTAFLAGIWPHILDFN